jgi:hypothetical protein
LVPVVLVPLRSLPERSIPADEEPVVPGTDEPAAPVEVEPDVLLIEALDPPDSSLSWPAANAAAAATMERATLASNPTYRYVAVLIDDLP